MNASVTDEKGALTPSRLGTTDLMNLNGGVCVHARASIRTRLCTCVCMCVRIRDVFAMYDNNISPRLIMIIIKIIILYFIQIRHTDDFPSTGTRLVYINIILLTIFTIMCMFDCASTELYKGVGVRSCLCCILISSVCKNILVPRNYEVHNQQGRLEVGFDTLK